MKHNRNSLPEIRRISTETFLAEAGTVGGANASVRPAATAAMSNVPDLAGRSVRPAATAAMSNVYDLAGRSVRPAATAAMSNVPDLAGRSVRQATTAAEPSHSRRLGKISLIVMLALLLTKVTGQLRQILIGIRFGYDTPYADAFTQGFLIPDFIYTLLIGGAIQAAIIPYLSSSIESGREKDGWRAVSSFITFMAILMGSILLICEIFAPLIMQYFTTSTSYQMAVTAARALLPQAFFMMLAALLIGILNTYKKFITTALTPCIYNILVLLSLLVLAKRTDGGVKAASVGITAAAAIYFLIQLFSARREIINFRLGLNLNKPEVRELFSLAVPTLVSASIPYFSSFLISSYYKYFADGTSYAYSNAISTWQLPFGIVVIAITNVTLPHLAELFTRKDFSGASKMISTGLRSALLIIIPAALCFGIMRQDVIAGIFRWGRAMSSDSVNYTAQILRWYCPVMVTHTVTYFLNNVFYANHKTWVPMAGAAFNLLMLFIFTRYTFAHTGFGPESMAFSFALSSFASTILLLVLMAIFFPKIKLLHWQHYAVITVFATVAAGGLLWLWQTISGDIQPTHKLSQLLYLLVRAVFAYGIYFYVANIFGITEVRYIKQKVFNKFKK